MADTPLTALDNAIIFTGDAFVEGHALLLKDGKVLDIVTSGRIPAAAETTPCPDRILVPGYIDCQVNGGGNVSLNNTPTPEAARAIAEAHARCGTTRLLPTCITDKAETMTAAIAAVAAAQRVCPHILGIHLEGPHLATARRGVHRADALRDLTEADIALYRPQDGATMLITLAPERATPEQIHRLRHQGVIVSLGHTGADAAMIGKALAAGATGFTHLFNGMGGLSARDPAVAGAALDDRDSWCGIIADGHHVAPSMIRLAHRAKPQGKLFLVSDAMPPAASAAPLPFKLYDETITVEGARCQTQEGRFAGSALTLAEAVKYCIATVGLAPEESLRMASAYPAAFLGLGQTFGKLLPTYTADILALDHAFTPQSVWADGQEMLEARKANRRHEQAESLPTTHR